MDDERTRNQKNSSGKSRDNRGLEPRSANDVFFLLEALPVLFVVACIATGMPRALEIAANHATASAAIFIDLETTDQGHQALEGVEEEYEPLITDDLRTEGVMYALADVSEAIGC